MVLRRRRAGSPSADRIRLATGCGTQPVSAEYAAQRTIEHAFGMFHNQIVAGGVPSNIEIERLAHALDAADLRDNGPQPGDAASFRLQTLLDSAIKRRRTKLGPHTCDALNEHAPAVLARAERLVGLRTGHLARPSVATELAEAIGLSRIARR